jgi:sulfide dehydrogenase cytochrome subunit
LRIEGRRVRPLFLGLLTGFRAGWKLETTTRKTVEEFAMIRKLLVAAFLPGAALALPALAQGVDPNLGRNLAAACANCHGTGGVAQQGMPNLAGQQRTNLVQQMQDFKTGKRPATIMHQIAKGYTDEQIEALAGHFSAQKAR